MPCSRLALTAHEFSGLVSGRGSISSFLRAPLFTPKTPCSGTPPGCAVVNNSFCGGENLSSPPRAIAEKTSKDGSDRFLVGQMNVGETLSQACASGRNSSSGSSKSNLLDAHGGGQPPPLAFSCKVGEETCEKCGETVAMDMLREHLDFHYAEELQERYSREGYVAGDIATRNSHSSNSAAKRSREGGGDRRATNSSSSGRRAKPGRRTDVCSMPPIYKFFKPA